MFRTSLGLLLLCSLPAAATGTFPSDIQTQLGLSSQPACGLCHTNGVTGSGTVNTPFGKAMRANGLVANNDASLKAALDALQTKGTDSDGDGTGDIAELKAGRNPNVADGAPTDGGTEAPDAGTPALPSPTYGCGANAVPGVGLTGLLALAALARRRR